MRTEAKILFEKLASLCEGLWFPSESDAELSPFFWEEHKDISQKENFLCLLQQLLETNTSTLTFNEKQKRAIRQGELKEIEDLKSFMQRVTEDKEWHSPERQKENQAYRELLHFMQDELESLKLYQLGEGVEKDIYLLGKSVLGGIAGFRTTLVQT